MLRFPAGAAGSLSLLASLTGFAEQQEVGTVEAERHAQAVRLETERRAAHDLAIAKEVQSRLFPQRQPLLATLTYAGICYPARAVGGDYYDFLDLGNGRLGLVLADISGKGMAAALLMANLQANLRSQCATASEQPHRFLKSVNQLFYENTAASDYATLYFAEYDDQSRGLRYANCGHLPALLLRRDGGLERLESTSTVMGIGAQGNCLKRWGLTDQRCDSQACHCNESECEPFHHMVISLSMGCAA
jgi:serine phosphatase RsbU (regulator of sigma subunit)